QAGGRSDVLEGAVPPIVEQHVAAPGGGYVQVFPTVVVVVRERGSYENPAGEGHARLCGDVDERPVAHVAVQGVPAQLVEKVDVLAAVVVVIADRQSRPVIVQIDVELLALFLREVMHPKRDPGFLSALLKASHSSGRLGVLAAGDQPRGGYRDGQFCHGATCGCVPWRGVAGPRGTARRA